MTLINITLISGTGQWEFLIRKFPNLTPRAISEALGSLKSIILKVLSNKLDIIGKVDIQNENQ